VTPETSGIAGAAKVSAPMASRKPASMGSISGEWKAWLTTSRRVLYPSAASRSASSVTSASAPESTTEPGPFTAAIATVPASPSSQGVRSFSAMRTATIAPPGGRSCIIRPRAATRRP